MSCSSGASRIEILAAALGHQRVRRRRHRRRVDADRGDRRLGPDPRQQRAGADRRHPVEQAGLLAQPRLVVVEVGGHARLQARHRDLAVVVVQAREHPDQGGERVGHGAAEHARVDAVVERRHGDDHADHAAQRGGQRRLADGPVRGVGEHDRVGPQLLAVPLEDGRQRVGADLLLALDEDRHPDRQRPGVRAQRGDVRHDRRPCRRRRRGRRAARRARWARTAGCPSSASSPGGCTSWWA